MRAFKQPSTLPRSTFSPWRSLFWASLAWLLVQAGPPGAGAQTLATALNSNLVWRTGGDVPWFTQVTNTYDGVAAARSGQIADSQKSWVEADVAGPVFVSWWWKVSSETNYDRLRLYVGGAPTETSICGTVNWKHHSVFVPAGLHTLRWAYEKDNSASAGDDAAWLDSVATYGRAGLLGGGTSDLVYASARDGEGNVYVAGRTFSPDFPATSDAYCPEHNSPGDGDAFVAKFNPDLTVLMAATFIGGSRLDEAHSVAVDPAGNVFVAGDTTSPDFPTTTNAFQWVRASTDRNMFVCKLSPDLGALLASTYLGGTNYDANFAMALDSQGNVYVAGQTASPDFPTAADAYARTARGAEDAVVSKLDGNLSALLASTFLGGQAEDLAYALSFDSGGALFVAGQTRSPDFPATPGAFCAVGANWDCFISKLDTNLSRLLASARLGYNSNDLVYAMLPEAGGTLVIAGETSSSDFSITRGTAGAGPAGGYDAFVARMDGSLSNVLAATLLGGSEDDAAYVLSLEATGKIVVSGDTYSTNFPLSTSALGRTLAGGCDTFVTRLSGDLTQIFYSSYLGGAGDEFLYAAIPSRSGGMYLIGDTYSAQYPPNGLAGDPVPNAAPNVFLHQVSTRPISEAWRTQYGLPADGRADFDDSDGDGVSNWLEYWAGTIPTDSRSALRLLRPRRVETNGTGGLLVQWQNVPGRRYTVERSTNLLAQLAFIPLATDLSSTNETGSYLDTTASGPGPWFYRVSAAAAPPQIRFVGKPQVSGGTVQVDFEVTGYTTRNAFQLWKAASPAGAWARDPSAQLQSLTPDARFRFTTSTLGASSAFYRVVGLD